MTTAIVLVVGSVVDVVLVVVDVVVEVEDVVDGATVVCTTVMDVVGGMVVGATVVGATVVGATVVVGTTLRFTIAVASETFVCEPIPS